MFSDAEAQSFAEQLLSWSVIRSRRLRVHQVLLLRARARWLLLLLRRLQGCLLLPQGCQQCPAGADVDLQQLLLPVLLLLLGLLFPQARRPRGWGAVAGSCRKAGARVVPA